MIDKIGAIVVENKKLLVTRSSGKNMFFVPGGKREPGENDVEALHREVKEELNVTVKSHRYYKTFIGPNHDGTKQVKITAYFVVYDGSLEPSNEIEELLWVSREDFSSYSLGNMLKIMIPELVKDEIL